MNRISILMIDQRKAGRMKWIVAAAMGLVDVSVFYIWILAQLQNSSTWIHANNIWNWSEQGLFLIIDAGLNFYFVYRVKSRLVSKGLTKYMPLFKYNAAIVVVSIAMDVTIIGMMSIPISIMLNRQAQHRAQHGRPRLKVVRKHGEGTQGRSKSEKGGHGTCNGYPVDSRPCHMTSRSAHLTNSIFSDNGSGGSEVADMQRTVSVSDSTREPGIKKTTAVTQSQVKEEDESWSEDSSTKQLRY